MGTRGCVAIGSLESWTGVYNHWDSYPAGLGEDLWAYIQSKDNLKLIRSSLLNFDSWHGFLEGGLCKYCGKVRKCEAHSIMAGRMPYGPIPDPDCLYHQHEIDENINYFSTDNPDPLSIEYVYIIDKDYLHILGSHPVKNISLDGVPQTPVHMGNGNWNYGHCVYKHDKLVSLPLDYKKEPNWGAMAHIRYSWYE